ncbi:hypothetical protein RJT34_31363 [Clitoria ternatea]|uniref:F-box domain-containing protein n=1 Tax=Clitoria ternatea TaxID=43366 RepID=A0AAN9EUX0_CLITE
MEKKRRLGFQLLDLPVHLLQQIMIHLPPSSVPPCAAVCTVFRNIAADPSFRQLYFSQTPISCVLLSNNHRLSILPSHSPLPPSSSSSSCFAVANSSPSVGHTIPDHTKTLSSITLNKSMNLVNSSHGLVCLRSNIRYHVCNPLSGEFLTLPPPPTPLDGDDEEYFSVFGFDPQRNHYKILQIVPEKMVAELYQIGDDTWRAIYFPPSALLKLNSVFDPSLNGALHWITTSTRLEELICSFDLNREEFRGPSQSPIRDLVDGGGCWRKAFSIDIDSYCGLQPQDKHRPIGFSSNGDMWLTDDEDDFDSDISKRCLVSYIPKKRDFRQVEIGGIPSTKVEATPHVLTYVPLKDIVDITNTHLHFQIITPFKHCIPNFVAGKYSAASINKLTSYC